MGYQDVFQLIIITDLKSTEIPWQAGCPLQFYKEALDICRLDFKNQEKVDASTLPSVSMTSKIPSLDISLSPLERIL